MALTLRASASLKAALAAQGELLIDRNINHLDRRLIFKIEESLKKLKS